MTEDQMRENIQNTVTKECTQKSNMYERRDRGKNEEGSKSINTIGTNDIG